MNFTSDTEVEKVLSASQLEVFEEKGWLVIPKFFSAAEVREIAASTDELQKAPEVVGRHMVYHEQSLIDPSQKLIHRIENFVPFFPDFAKLALSGKLMASVEQLFGSKACFFKDKLNFKMPGGSAFEGHQDQQAGWSIYAPIFITALVSIDPATVENGCLWIADIPRIRSLIGTEWKPLTREEMAAFPVHVIPTEPGDVVFFDSFVPHGSKPNFSSQTRRIVYFTYNSASAGDQCARYFADKRASFPPDIEREPGKEYKFRV
ncbi:MAG: phytanoyl-CoA dioxygenase family protein [Alphaproteobacteria bacterium]|nr:phytanoyl-CoA dioxygenase family protein [Alphaproteobacteria bacterium]